MKKICFVGVLYFFICFTYSYAQQFKGHLYNENGEYYYSDDRIVLDFNNDGLSDFFDVDKKYMFINIGDGEFKRTNYLPQSRINKILDYNRDGFMDFIYFYSDKLYVYKNTNGTQLVLDTTITIPSFNNYYDVKIDTININNDNYTDLFLINSSDGKMFTLYGDIDGFRDLKRIKGYLIHRGELFIKNMNNDYIDDIVFKDADVYYTYNFITADSIYFVNQFINNIIGYEVLRKETFIDLNNDKNEDLLYIINTTNDSLYRFKIKNIVNNSIINTYTLDSAKTTNWYPQSFELYYHDFNNDGLNDIVIKYNYIENQYAYDQLQISVYLNKGNFQFQKIDVITEDYKYKPISNSKILFGKFNNDNFPDLLLSNMYFENVNNTKYKLKLNDSYAYHFEQPLYIDINNDGLKDIIRPIYGSYSFDQLVGQINEGNLHFSKPFFILDSIPMDGFFVQHSTQAYTKFFLDDVNNDSKIDLVINHLNKIFTAINTGNNRFTIGNTYFINSDQFSYTSNMLYIDINNDSKKDLVFPNQTNLIGFGAVLNIYKMINTGNGTFLQPEIIQGLSRDELITALGLNDFQYSTIDLSLANINNDNKIDIIFNHSNSGPENAFSFAMVNNGNETFTYPVLLEDSLGNNLIDLTGLNGRDIEFYDINNDNKNDLIYKSYDNTYNTLNLIERINKGNYKYSKEISVISNFAATNKHFINDLNGDNIKDVFLLPFNLDNSQLAYYKGLPNNLFSDTLADAFTNTNDAYDVFGNDGSNNNILYEPVDIDNDNDLDIIYANSSRRMTILENLLNSQNTIVARCYWDKNNNKLKDSNEPFLANQAFSISPNVTTGFSNDSGIVYFNLTNGIYQLKYNSNPFWQCTTDSILNNITLPAGTQNIYYFGLNARIPKDSFIVDLTTSGIRCLRNFITWINVKNIGNTELNGSIIGKFDQRLNIEYSIPTGQNIDPFKYSWQQVNAIPSYSYSIFNSILAPNQANQFDSINFQVYAAIKNIDSIKYKYDTIYNNFPIRCSFDPNDKSVAALGKSINNKTLMNTPLQYTIRFQNTGTDTAYDITIKDTISNNLDIKTFQLISSSHLVNTSIVNNIITFRFNQINLPDSNTNWLKSQGFIKFNILPKANLASNTTVNNKASIFFDFNNGITTNTASITYVITLPLVINVSNTTLDYFNIYPNPTNKNVTINWKFKDQTKNVVLKIYDISGNEIDQRIIYMSNTTFEYNTENLAKGMYLINLFTDEGLIGSKKLVVQ